MIQTTKALKHCYDTRDSPLLSAALAIFVLLAFVSLYHSNAYFPALDFAPEKSDNLRNIRGSCGKKDIDERSGK